MNQRSNFVCVVTSASRNSCSTWWVIPTLVFFFRQMA